MGKLSSSVVPASQGPQTFSSSSAAASTTKSQDGSSPYASKVLRFFEIVGISDPNVDNYRSKDFYSNLLRDHLKTDTVQRGHVTCFATVKPAVANYFGGLHGGVVPAIAERVAIATVRTVVGVEKDIFLGELGISYLSAAPTNVELIVDGSIVRSGRNITVVAVEFKMKETGKLVYIGRATLYNSPIAKL
ncbi:PREDICTED: uncharacterized protein LOC108663800 [Theobroma cacao]|uniref:Uncharacterized protein LOC108663800 n=1 Tax=Theobroma cacao TaxID=3641 RepID=A0AB32X390_THECC|nr:PREDICTED: uncharacterized protein LOC108663800 [Theobroma cacao]